MSKISAGKTIIDVHDGIGIESITGNYLATNENEGVTIETKGWSETPQEMNEISKYLWSYETIVLTDGHVQNTRPVLIGVYGDEGVGIEEVIEYYLISDQDSGISHTDDWSTIVPTMTSEEKYLWNYEEIIFTDGTRHESNPVLIGVYGDKGTSVKAIRNFYLATSAKAGVTRETSGFTSEMQDLTPQEKYLWNYEIVDYENPESSIPTEPVIIGVYGDKGEDARLITLESSAQIFSRSEEGDVSPKTITMEGKTQSTSISQWEYSVDGLSFTSSDIPAGLSRTGNQITIDGSKVVNRSIAVRATDGTFSDTVTVAVVEDGETGSSGSDAYTVLLTNESHTFAGSETSALTGSTTAGVVAYKGTERIVSSVNSVSGAPNGMTYDILGNGTEDNKVIFNVNTSMKTLDGDITISLTVDGKEFEKQFSYALALKGERGQRGMQGVEGEKGKDGKTTYTWIRYADNANGGGMSNSPVGKDYIGLAHNKETSVESSVAGEYTWSLFRGPQGGQGVEGPPGENGEPTYTWIRYSANANGFGLTSTPQSNTQYIGIATNKSAQTPSNTPGDYTWSLFKGPKGEKGDDGYTPVKGTDYFDGEDGQDGASSYLWVRYSDNLNGSGMRTDPTGAEYIGTATTSEAVAPKEPGAYNWVLVKGKDGLAGESGNDGETSYLHIKYSNDGGKTLTGNSGEDAGEWIGTYVDFVKEDSLNTDFYTWNKVKGEKGDQGEDGDDAILGVLDNESHVIPTDAYGDHGNYVGANASMIIFNGHHEDTDNWKFFMKASDGVTGSQTINTYTVRDLSGDTGTVTFKAEREGYSDVIKVFTLTKSKQGHKGEDATAYSLALDSQVIQKDSRDDSLTPGSLSISGQKKVGEGDFNPFPGYFVIYEQSRESMTVDKYTGLALTGDVGEDEYILSSSAYPYVVRYRSDDLESDIDYDIFKDPMNIRIDWYKDSDYTILLDRAVVPVVSDGKDAVVGMLTNEAMTFPADKEGKVVSYANNSGQFMIYDGARDVSEYTKFDTLNQKNVVITIDERGYYSIRGMTDGIDILDGEAILTASYKDIVIQKTVVVSKSLAGDDGDSATSYWISPSVNTVTKHVDESIDPKTITFNAMSKTGEEDPKGYSGRFVVQISNDGVSYSNHYTSSSNASSYTYSVPEDTSFIKAKLYQAGGLVYLLDEETIPVLQEIKGEDGVGVQKTDIHYAKSTSGTTKPSTGWNLEVPSTSPGDYIWTRMTWTYTDGDTEEGYSVSHIGKNGNTGNDGAPGKDGVGIKETVINYATSSSGTTKPTSGWDPTIPSVTPGNYLWTRTTWTYTDNDTEEGYSVSRIGEKGDKGDAGVSITKVDVEYAQNTSATSAPTSGWSTDAPTWKNGEYIWSRTKTTYSSGNPTYSKPACITGQKGSVGGEGNDGKGISDIIEQYYLSDSKETRTGGSWTTTVPKWEQGKYMWTRSQIKWTNPTDTTYTTPIVDTAWEAMQEGTKGIGLADKTEILSGTEIYTDKADDSVVHVEVDGKSYQDGDPSPGSPKEIHSLNDFDVVSSAGKRNLHKGTSDEWRENHRPEGNWFFEQSTDIKLELGETYTFSIIVERVSSDTVPINLHFGIGNNSYNWDRGHWGSVSNIPMGEKITRTFTVSEEDLSRGYETFAWRLRNERRETTIRFKEVKLEKSNYATPWVPHISDITEDSNHPLIDKINLSLSEPLRSMGDVHDRLFRDSDGLWRVERNVMDVVFGNNLKMTNLTSTTNNGVEINSYWRRQADKYNHSQMKSSHFNGDGTRVFNHDDAGVNTLNRNSSWDNMIIFNLRKEEFPTLSSFNDWLVAQENNGTPVHVIYELETPTIETLDQDLQDKLNNLRSFQDSNYVYTMQNNIENLDSVVIENLSPTLHATFKGGGWYQNWRVDEVEKDQEELRTESESLQEQIGNYVPESLYSEDIGEINQSLIDYQDALELAKEQIYGMFDDEGNLVVDDDGNPVQPGVMRDISALLERTVALQEDFGEKTVQWSFLDTKFIHGDEGMFIGEPDTLTGIMISPATSNEPSRIDFLDGDREKPVAFITSDLMRINRGIFVESATIGEHKIQTHLDGHTIWQWIP